MSEQVHIPFLTPGRGNKGDANFIDMIRNRICPHFALPSFTTIILGACLILFIVTRVLYAPGGYSNFLQHPKEMDGWALQIEKNHSNKLYYYQTVTAMFLHNSYIHIISNLIFALFVMYELEYCWRLGILACLIAGFAANSIALATMEGILMGFSGALCGCVGIVLAALMLHCTYLRATYGSQFYLAVFFCIIMVIMVVGMSSAALVHFMGLFFGLLFGLALYPRRPEANINENIDKLLKIFAAGFLVLAVFLGLIV